jgi:hypothetical protein
MLQFHYPPHSDSRSERAKIDGTDMLRHQLLHSVILRVMSPPAKGLDANLWVRSDELCPQYTASRTIGLGTINPKVFLMPQIWFESCSRQLCAAATHSSKGFIASLLVRRR